MVYFKCSQLLTDRLQSVQCTITMEIILQSVYPVVVWIELGDLLRRFVPVNAPYVIFSVENYYIGYNNYYMGKMRMGFKYLNINYVSLQSKSWFQIKNGQNLCIFNIEEDLNWWCRYIFNIGFKIYRYIFIFAVLKIFKYTNCY